MGGKDVSSPPPAIVRVVMECVAKKRGYVKPRFQVESGSHAGDGYLSSMYRVTLTDEDASDGNSELKVMCKTSLVEIDNLMQYVFPAEGHMYDAVLPALEDIAHMKEPLPWPRCFHVAVDCEPPLCLALGDLRPQGFVMADRRVPLDEGHCRVVLQQLARLHGAGMALQHLKPAVMQALRDEHVDPYAARDVWEFFQPTLRAIQDTPNFVKQWYAEGTAVNASLKTLYRTFMEDHNALLYPGADAVCTFVHGDCHVNNALFKYDKVSAAVTECRLIDFQFGRYANPAIDLATLLLVGTSRTVRGQHLESLLRGYLQELHATLRDAGCGDPDSVFSWDQLQRQLRRASLLGLSMAPVMLNAMYADDEVVQNVQETYAASGENCFSGGSETAGQVVEHQETSSIMIRPTEQLKIRIADLVHDMEDWGWLPTADEIDKMRRKNCQDVCL